MQAVLRAISTCTPQTRVVQHVQEPDVSTKERGPFTDLPEGASRVDPETGGLAKLEVDSRQQHFTRVFHSSRWTTPGIELLLANYWPLA